MKNHSKKIAAVAGLICLLVAGTAMALSYSVPVGVRSIEIADTTTTCNGSTGCVGNGTQTVVTLLSTPTGAVPGRPSCGDATPAIVVLYSPTGQIDHIKSMTNIATSAFLAGKTLKVFYEGGCSDGVARAKAIVIQ